MSTLILRINDFVLYSERRDINPTVLSIFCESDKRIFPVTEKMLTEAEDDSDNEEYDEDEPPLQYVVYTTSANAALDRLELTGFSLAQAKKSFDEELAEELCRSEPWKQNSNWVNEGHKIREELEESVLRSFTFVQWMDGMRILHREPPTRASPHGVWVFDWWEQSPELPLHARYMLGKGSSDMFGFPGCDCRPYLRAALEAIGSQGQAILDLTDLVEGEYVNPEDDVCSWSRRELADDAVINHKIVVLIEGKNDRFVLEGAMRLLYPHLAEFYSFTDFEASRAGGGAGVQVNTLKAFIGAGIVNRTIAIFDNDTAAQVALRSLRSVKLPGTIRVLKYPDSELARSYPTLGPQGISTMDVNGLAAGIELYLGREVLQQENGSLTPVQWRGYDQSIKQYQGEVLDKDELHKKFAEKLRVCQTDPSKVSDYDWSGIRSILEAIRSAFAGS